MKSGGKLSKKPEYAQLDDDDDAWKSRLITKSLMLLINSSKKPTEEARIGFNHTHINTDFSLLQIDPEYTEYTA